MKKDGLKMRKDTGYGIFWRSYDEVTCYSLKELFEANRKGFYVKNDVGIFLLNCFTV